MKLSATEGYCYAYYPYSSSASTITSIPVTAGGTDYLYATKVSVNDKSKTASLTMKQAWSAIRFALKKGTYAGTGKVTAVSVTSAALGSSGTLNATTGAVTAANKGTAVSQTTSLTLNGNAQNVDVVMVPSGSAGTITLSVTIDGKAYSTTVNSTTIAQGSCYTYTITVNAGNLALSGVKVGAWGYNSAGNPTITAAGYTVTFAGNYSDIAFGNSVSGNTVTIKAINYDGYKVKEVSASSGATLTQSVTGYTRVITLTNITSNVTVTFNGVLTSPAAIADTWEGLPDGIYWVRFDLKPAAVDNEAVLPQSFRDQIIGVALINTAKNQRLMIEKYENANNAESTTIYTNAAQRLGSSETDRFSWGGYGTDQSGVTTYTAVGAGSSDRYGYLYLDGSGLNINPSTWTTGALSDFSGKSNSNVIKNLTTNGSSSSTTAPMSYLLNAFNASTCPQSVNKGYTDWYIPSCGQLGLIWLNLTAINNALAIIGGTPFTEWKYQSSSENSSVLCWLVSLSNGLVNLDSKSTFYRVRLVRDL